VSETEPGWFYVGNGQLRFKDGNEWTDEYRDIDQKPDPTPTESQSPDPEASASDRPRSKKRAALIASAGMVAMAATGVYFLALRPLPTAVSWTQSVSAIARGDYLTISGQITPAVSGRQIQLETASAAQGQWLRLPQASSTDSRGRFAMTVRPKLSGSILVRVVVGPAGRYVEADGASKPLRLLSSSKIRLAVVPARTSLNLTIAVSPPSGARTVRTEKSRDRRHWTPIGSPARTRANGTVLVTVPDPGVGVWSYRAVVARDGRFAAAVSPAISPQS